MEALKVILPHVNAGLNSLATLLLIAGYLLIRNRRETAHKWTMLASFGVSTLFLVCYLVYHAIAGSRPFPADAAGMAIAYGYYAMLLSHVVLAATVPFLAIATIYFGLREDRRRHRFLARFTFPIWLYVSITGVLVYVMLYQIPWPS